MDDGSGVRVKVENALQASKYVFFTLAQLLASCARVRPGLGEPALFADTGAQLSRQHSALNSLQCC